MEGYQLIIHPYTISSTLAHLVCQAQSRPGSLLEATSQQYSMLRQNICRAATNVSLLNILLRVVDTSYSPCIMEPF